MCSDIVDVLINLVADDPNLRVAAEHCGKCFQFGCAIYRACGVARRAENQGFGLRCDGSLELFGRDFEILFDGCFNEDGLTVCHEHHLRITDPVGRGNNHLLARRDECHDGVADTLLCTVGADDLFGRIVQTVFVLEFLDDGFAECGIACDGRVAREVVINGFFGSLFDVVGSVEVRFSDGEVDDIDALRFEFSAFLRHGEGGGGRQSVHEG